MDVRTSTNPVVRGAVAGMEWLNARYPWDHNEHYHGWILRNLPPARLAALDIGCGAGLLVSRLANAGFGQVVGIDRFPDMVQAARERCASREQVTIQQAELTEFAAATQQRFDVITMVAVLHHLDLDDDLAAVRGLLAPDGRLLVVGMARVDSIPDLAVDLAGAIATPAVGWWRNRGRAVSSREPERWVMPMRDPEQTIAQIRQAAATHLGPTVVHRRLHFRYTLRYDAPSPVD